MYGMEIRINYGKRDLTDWIEFDVEDAEPSESIGLMLAEALGYCTQEPISNLAHALDWIARPRNRDAEHAELTALLDAAAEFCKAYRKECDQFNQG